MHNKERFVDNSKKKSLQDCVMIIRFLNTAKGFSVRNVYCSYTKAILSVSRILKRDGAGFNPNLLVQLLLCSC